MKKKLLIAFFVIVAIGAGVSCGLYRYGRLNSARLPDFLVDNLGYAGIHLSYREAGAGPGVSARLRDVTIDGARWNRRVTAASLIFGFRARWAWPPLAIYVDASHVAVLPSDGKAKPQSANGSPFAAIALKTLPVEIRANDLDVAPYALKDSTLRLVASRIELDADGVKGARLHHELRIGSSGKTPWLNGARWGGESSLEHTRFRAMDHALSIGPVLLSARGQFDSATEKWDAEIGIPKTQLATPSVHGEVALRFHAQGIGRNSEAINVEGKIKTKDLAIAVQHPKIHGEIIFNVDADVTREQSLALKGTGDIDLTKAALSPGILITKPVGTPLTAHLELAGKENHIVLTRGDLKWAGVPLSVLGAISVGPRVNANLTFEVPPIPVPQIPNATVSGEIVYRGAIDDPSLLLGNLHLKLPHGHGAIVGQLELHPTKSLTYTIRGAGKTLTDVLPLAGLDPARFALVPEARVSGTSTLTLPSGLLVTTSNWDGRLATVTVKAETVRAEEVVPDIARGKLSAGLVMHFTGTTDEEKKRSLRGEGNFVITEGSLPVLKFSKKPLEELKSIPLLGSAIRTTDIDDHFTRLSGTLHLNGATTRLTGLSLRTPQFDFSSDEVWIDAAKNLNGRVLWIPHGLLMRPLALELLRDHATGKTAIPLALGGTLANPSAKVDIVGLLARIKGPSSKARTRIGRLGRHLNR